MLENSKARLLSMCEKTGRDARFFIQSLLDHAVGEAADSGERVHDLVGGDAVLRIQRIDPVDAANLRRHWIGGLVAVVTGRTGTGFI